MLNKEDSMEKIIPVVVIHDLKEVDTVMNALRADGLHCAEITFRSACAADAIRRAAENYPEMEVGAGTVINGEQCKQALAAGARFIVSPGLSENVAKLCRDAGVPYYPGCVTPTEIMRALELGLTTIKFFPAHLFGGLKAIQSLAGPFPQVKFIPTGGINRDNLEAYLSLKNVAAVGGSFFVKDALEKWEAKQ